MSLIEVKPPAPTETVKYNPEDSDVFAFESVWYSADILAGIYAAAHETIGVSEPKSIPVLELEACQRSKISPALGIVTVALAAPSEAARKRAVKLVRGAEAEARRQGGGDSLEWLRQWSWSQYKHEMSARGVLKSAIQDEIALVYLESAVQIKHPSAPSFMQRRKAQRTVDVLKKQPAHVELFDSIRVVPRFSSIDPFYIDN